MLASNARLNSTRKQPTNNEIYQQKYDKFDFLSFIVYNIFNKLLLNTKLYRSLLIVTAVIKCG